MSDIFEFKDKIDKDRSRGFVSFESLILGKRGDDVDFSDPIGRLEKKKAVLKLEIDEMLTRAEAEKKRIEQEAYDKGLAQGLEEGRKAGKDEFGRKTADALQLIGALELERGRVNLRYQEDLLALLKTMVERLVGHEVSVNPLVIKNCLQSAMAFVVEDSVVKVHLHPEDFQRLRELSLEDPSLLQGAKRVELLEDPVVSQGGCLLETDFGEIDATLENCREKLFDLVNRAFMAALAADRQE